MLDNLPVATRMDMSPEPIKNAVIAEQIYEKGIINFRRMANPR